MDIRKLTRPKISPRKEEFGEIDGRDHTQVDDTPREATVEGSPA